MEGDKLIWESDEIELRVRYTKPEYYYFGLSEEGQWVELEISKSELIKLANKILEELG